ncbi:hypothetical protein [Homoserinibacter sp. GY 40078]|uniref:hypothetical protein n=1 Tax=Homoserinibacter sp. GY 40078 TaxID=2603275 RepID=UPI0011C729A9|nr:hypothetical protein [Homoserinibacter sp. GY 40078]TXK18894.1 hypothetical protein FVQ89_02860 [Homoserinibacter sp. GY 40078]
MRRGLGRGLRAALLLVTSIGLALGLATTATCDPPTDTTSFDVICLSVLGEQTASAGAVDAEHAAGGIAATIAGLLFVVLMLALLRPTAWLLRVAGLPHPPAPSASGELLTARAPSRPLLLTLSVIRI